MVGGRASAALLLAALCFAGLHAACTEAAQHAAVQESVADYAWLREPKLEQMQASDSDGTLARRLLNVDAAQQFFTLKPQCAWDDGVCTPLMTNWFQFRGMPSSPHRKAILMASSRAEYCHNTHKTANACNQDQQHRCYWYAKRGVCNGIDLSDLRWYNDKNFTARVNTLPAAMTCPGTKAAEMIRCFAGATWNEETCQHMPGCYMGSLDSTKLCLPTFVKSFTSSDQLFELSAGIAAVDPKVFGKCEAACWVRQAKKCFETTKAGKDTCNKIKYCGWDSSAKVCVHLTYEFSDSEYEQKVKRLYAMCVFSENKQDCESSMKAKVTFENGVDWKNFKQSSEDVQCQL
jgi:hypothetical protein